MPQTGPASRDNVSCVLPFYVPEDAAITERIVRDLGRVNIQFYEEGGEGMAPGVYTTLLAFVSEAAAQSDGLRAAVEHARAEGKGVVAVYLNGEVPEGLGGLLDYAEEFVHRPGGEEALLRRLATAHDMRACRKETLEPYEGPLDYIFVSYAHKNSADVLPVIRDLQDEGFRVWYDAGIEVGSEWDAYIMDHLERCKAFICFQSPEFRASTYCKQEIDHALEHVPGAVVVACVNPNEGVEYIPEGLRKFQGVLRHDCDTDKDFFEKLISAGELEPCRDEYRISADGKVLEKYLGGSAVVRVPEGVEEIGPRAIVTPNARKVIVPDSVTKISEQAFIGCGLLEEVVLPDTVTEIGKEAFLGCGALREITIPPELETVEESCFAGCVALEKLSFAGNKVEDLMPHAFEDCSSLVEINWPDSIKRLWRYCFASCSSLDLEVPPSVEALAAWTVYKGCRTINVHCDNTVYSYKSQCMLDACGEMLYWVSPWDATGYFEVPNGIKWLGGKPGASVAPRVALPNSLFNAFIKGLDSGFSNCTEMSSVVLPEGLVSIRAGAFSNCESLCEVDLPESLEAIGVKAFSNCSSLESITLPKGLKEINAEAFSGCCALGSIVLPEGLQASYPWMFRGCVALKSVVLPNSWTELADGLFVDCQSIQEMILPEKLTLIRSSAFSGCSSLTRIVLPSGVEEIGDNAFMLCTSLESIELASSINEIGRKTFEGCSALLEISIPTGVDAVRPQTFLKCASLKRVQLPKTIRSIGSAAFKGCESLVEISIPEELEEISPSAFEGCSSLKLPDRVRRMMDAREYDTGAFQHHNRAVMAEVSKRRDIDRNKW